MTLKKKLITSVVFFLILSILLIVFAIFPVFSGIRENSHNFPVQKQSLAVLEREFENLQKFKRIWPEVSPSLERIDNLFFVNDPRSLIDFRNSWYKNAQDSGVSLKISLAPSPQTTSADPWPATAFNFTSAGPFSNLLVFLEKLQSSDYLIEIQNLNIIRLSEAELRSTEFKEFSSGDVKANLLIKVYTKP